MTESTPVNKGTLASAGRRLPELANPLVIGALGVGALGAGIAMRAMRPARRRGRSSRFRTLVLATVDEAIRTRVADLDPSTPLEVRADVGEGFGKPALVTFDIVLPRDFGARSDALVDLLDAAARAVWDNRELAPLAIRGRVLAEDARSSCDAPIGEGGAPDPQTEGPLVLADMTALGFSDETARPDDLFSRYGSPASDPGWRP